MSTGRNSYGAEIANEAWVAATQLAARMEQKSRRMNAMVRRGFEVGEPVMAKDYPNRGSAWTKGIAQDRLGPVTYRVQVGSKVADIEPKSCELPEVDLPETLDASTPVPTHHLNNSLYQMSLQRPWVEVPPSRQIDPQVGNVTHTPVPTVPEEPRCCIMQIRSKPKRSIEEM